MRKTFHSLSLIFISVFLCFMNSCNTFDPPETIPVYGHVSKMSLETKYSTQGTDSAYITDAWVYLDDNPAGVFQMPGTFPMIASTGSHNIKIYPGIMQDGISTMRAIYPFYTFCDTNLNLTQGKTYYFSPNVSYNTWVHFRNMEDFEESVINIPLHIHNAPKAYTDTLMTIEHTDVYQGLGSGIVTVDAQHPQYTGMSDTMNLPNQGTTIYMELNYKCTTDFIIGIFSGDTNTQTYVMTVNPTSVWKKLYVNLQSTVDQNQLGPYRVYFNIQVANGQDELYLDNIKVLSGAP